MIKKRLIRALSTVMALVTLSVFTLAGCGSNTASDNNYTEVRLNPDKPVSLTIWHYYNGAQQAVFDTLIDEFNSTVGKDKGIYVEGYSQGSVSDLEKAVTSAINEEVGAGELPDIFSSYADTAYSAQQQGKLTDLTQYFSKDELSQYVNSYIDDGYFNDDGALYLLPVAKSTEIMMINKNDWEKFAEATNTSIDELSTTEGIVRVAEKYYNWTDSLTPDIPDDGKAFYGRDSMSNYFVIGMKQMGKEIFESNNGTVKLNTDKDLLKRLWDNYYVPYVKGYFASYGKFRSDDVKTGDIIAYTGSTSSAFYFPNVVENENGTYPIDCIVLNSPIMEGGENYKVQQGAGMAVTKSDKEHEYASSVFLKWFTEKEQNLRFVCNSGYLPVKKDANTMQAVDEVIKDNNIEMNQKAYDCLNEVISDFNNTEYYTTKSFVNGYSTRKVLDYNLSDKAEKDRSQIEEAVKNGADMQTELQKYISDEQFDMWYESFCEALNKAAYK